jgi:hypothetical protein
MSRNMQDKPLAVLRPYAILVFCSVYVLIQAGFIIKAHFNPDKRFGFWMFAETSRYQAQLYRQLRDGRVVKTPNGRWAVQTEAGRQVYAWNRFVRDFGLYNLERWKRAKVGFAVTLKYLQYALDYVIDHIPADRETVKLVLRIQYRKAQGPWQQTTLESRTRELPPAAP